jgi:cell division transport system permease protein
MRAIDYALRQGWTSLWRTRGSSTVAVAAIALALTVLGALLLVTWNARRAVGALAAAAEFSVYLRDDASSEQRGAIEGALEQSGVASRTEYVSKVQARDRFRSQYAEMASIADGLEGNPFPASIEVQVRPDADHAGQVEPLVRTVASMPGVEDVRYDREWLSRLGGGLRTAGVVGLLLAVLMALAAGVTVAAVVRLSLLARQEEIAIMELVGAPLMFIRGPFVAEGVLQGGIGALAALLALWGAFALGRRWWGADELIGLGGAIEFLPLQMCLYVLLGGMLVGGAGGFAAARHAGALSDPGR